MGWEQKDITVKARVSRHNSLRDRLDDARWEHFMQQLRILVQSKDYEEIELEIFE